MYRERFSVNAQEATLGAVPLPAGKVKFDETFQKNVETYRDVLRIAVPVQQANGRFRIAINYQGCADKGLCYPPMQMRADVDLVAYGGSAGVRVLPGRDMPSALTRSSNRERGDAVHVRLLDQGRAPLQPSTER